MGATSVEDLLLGIDLNPLSRVFAAAFILAAVPCLVYLLSLRVDTRVAVAAIGFIAAALGVVTAPDFFWFLIFWELMMLLTCWLIVQERRPGGFTVAYRYFLAHVAAGISLFFAIGIQYATTNSFEMGALAPEAVPFFVVACLIKAAVVPLHIWVPLTYPSVHPAVAVILSAYTTKVGVYAFARLLPGIPWIAYAGAFMALFGVAMALRQKTARQLLCYHLISQVGYMIVGIGIGSELGLIGGTFHMRNNMVYKSLLFMVAGAVLHRTGTDVLARVGGAGRSMLLTFGAGLIGAAAIAGLPPLNGYVSKTLLKAATEGHPFLQGALILAGIGTAFSFAKFTWYLFLHKPSSEAPASGEAREMTPAACLAMASLALLSIGLGVFYPLGDACAFNPTPYPVNGVEKMLWGVIPVFVGVALFAAYRGIVRAAKPSKRTSEDVGKPTGSLASASSPSRSESLPWDVDVVYSWLLSRFFRASRYIAMRTGDATHGYVLVITAIMVALVVFFSW